MRNSQIKLQDKRNKRRFRVRKRFVSSGKPRMSVHKSNKHISVQIIDDAKSHTLCAISTESAEFANTEFCKKNKVSARRLGVRIAEMAKEKNIKEIVFDRGQFKYHGILAELADGAREAGLQF